MNKTIPSPNYITSLHFDYIETYSFCRGEAFENAVLEKGTQSKYLQTTHLLWTPSGELEPTAQKLNTFSHNHPRTLQLLSILQTPAHNIPYWMCAPFYRDAIVFYDQHKNIVSTLNICLSCETMQTDPIVMIEADEKAHKLLKEYFIEIGHPVETDTPWLFLKKKK